MNESTRTLSYVGVAAVSVVLAAFFAPANPKAPDEFGDLGRPFYADFDATAAKSLTVVSFSEDSTRSKVFNVEQKDGKWIIGSHRNYPADGKDRLAKTAASVIGIKKEQFATKDPEQYVAMQVVDPLDEDNKKLKGRGQRVTLKDASGKVLADYIIGKRVPNRDSYYYIRNPGEKSVYMAKLNIDLSTKFADWIESDLLQLQGENLSEIVVNKYSIDKKKGKLVGQETNVLKRAKPADPWTLDGLDAAKEEVNQDEVRTMTTALADLKILGVREKPEGLSSDLKTDKGIALDQVAMRDLQAKGFYFQPDGQLICNEGEMIPITDAGVAYTLRFGEVFVGSELEMETGLEADQRKQEEKDGKKEKVEEKGSTKSRYVFITAHFDPAALGPKPEAPGKKAATPAEKTPAAAQPEEAKPAEEKPAEEKPAADKPAEEKPAEAAPEAKADEPAKKGDCQDAPEKAAEEKPEAAPEAKPEPEAKEPAAPEAKPAEAKPAEAKPEAAPVAAPAAPKGPTAEEQAKADLLAATKKYETDLKVYDDKVAKSQKKVKELNERFADWYYVISEENFLKLRLSRASLVKEKTKAEPKPGEAAPTEANPAEPKLEAQPEAKPAVEAPKADADKPAEPKPEEAKPEEPKAEEKKPEAAKPAEEKPAEPKPEEKQPESEKPAE